MVEAGVGGLCVRVGGVVPRELGSSYLVLEQQRGVLEPQVRAQRVDAAVGGGAVGAGRALRRVRVEVVPAVGHLLAARLAAPQRRAVGHGHKHAVVRVGRRGRHVRALCEQQPANASHHAVCARARARGTSHEFGETRFESCRLCDCDDGPLYLQNVNLAVLLGLYSINAILCRWVWSM